MDENLSPRKKKSVKKTLFDDTTSYSSVSYSQDNSLMRPPLVPLDINSTSISTRWAKGSSNQIKKHEKMVRAKALKLDKRNPK